MPTCCVVPNCKSRGSTGSDPLFYVCTIKHILCFETRPKYNFKYYNSRFPINDGIRLGKWLLAINRYGFIPKKSSRICNIHFLKTYFVDSPGGSYKLKLKPSTAPSVFPGRPVALSKLLSTFNNIFYACVVNLKKMYIINSFNIQ